MATSTYPVYVVSLEQDGEKRQALAESFPSFYSKMERINAVDGRLLSAREYFGYIAKPVAMGQRIMLPGEVGCSLSHINALERFLQSGAKAGLILEDDVIGNDEKLAKTLSLIEFLPSDALMICGGQEGMPARKYIFGKETKAEGLFVLPRYSNRHIFRTCCYVVTPQSAKEILSSHKDFLRLADAWGDFFANTGVHIYYTQLLGHPKDLQASHLEQERALFGHKASYGATSLSAKIRRRMSRIARKIGALRCLLSGYKPIAR